MVSVCFLTLTEGEQNRILALWQEYGAALTTFAKKELSSPDLQNDAEDIVSSAFERLMIHYERYGSRTDDQMKGLLFRIVKNLCMDAHRRNKRSAPAAENMAEETFAVPERSPEELVISEENIRRMKAIFRSLSPALKEVLEMKLNEEMTDGEIAKELHLSKRVVQLRLSRARNTVRIKWEAQEHDSRTEL